jgi:hypothetical protein
MNDWEQFKKNWIKHVAWAAFIALVIVLCIYRVGKAEGWWP